MFQDQLYAGLAQVPSGGQAAPDDFNKMFPNLAPFAGCTPAAIARVRELGRKGGLMDALDPRVTISNPLAANDMKTPHPNHPNRNPDNPNPDMTVGFTFLGQFIDHDLTFDPMPIRCNLPASPNLRSPFFDLDSIYGRGPDEDRLLYDRASELDRAATI